MEGSCQYTPVGEADDAAGIELMNFLALTEKQEIHTFVRATRSKGKEIRKKIFLFNILLLAVFTVWMVISSSMRSSVPTKSYSVTEDLCNINGDPSLCYCPPGMYGKETVLYNRQNTNCYEGKVCHVSLGLSLFDRIAESQACFLSGGCYDHIANFCYHTKIEDLVASVTCDEESEYASFCPQNSYVPNSNHMCIYGKMCKAPTVGSNVTITGRCYDMLINKCA